MLQHTTDIIKSITKIIAMIMLRILFIHHLKEMQIYYNTWPLKYKWSSISHFNWLVVFIHAVFVCCNVSSYKSMYHVVFWLKYHIISVRKAIENIGMKLQGQSYCALKAP